MKAVWENMLNRTLNRPLLYDTFIRDTAAYRIAQKDAKWFGLQYDLPYCISQQDSYIAGGALIKPEDLNEEEYVKGTIAQYKEIGGAIVINEKDLIQHGADVRIPRDSFLKIKLGKALLNAKARFSYKFGQSMLDGPEFDSSSAPGTATGILEVSNPTTFSIGQKIVIQQEATAADGSVPVQNAATNVKKITGWVFKIDVNGKKIHISANKKSTSPVDLSTLLLATASTEFPASKTTVINIYNEGEEPTLVGGARVEGGGFTSLKQQMLTAALGGSDTLFGLTKASYPILQPLLQSGAAYSTGEAFIFGLFDSFNYLVKHGQPYDLGKSKTPNQDAGNTSAKGRGAKVINALMSFDKMGVLQKFYQKNRAMFFKMTPKGTDLKFFDTDTMLLMGSRGTYINLMGVAGMPDDKVYILGKDTTRFASHKFIRVHQHISTGSKWHEMRIATGNPKTDGYKNVCDFYVFGEHMLTRPAGTACIYGLPATSTITV